MSEQPTTIASSIKLVHPIGPGDAKIALVGEAPGYHEVQLGEPFVGPSGKLLNELLHQAGLSRHSMWITNVIKEHPRNNNIRPFLDLDTKYPLESDAYLRYRALLKEELEGLDPNLIIVAGRVPLYALTGHKDIMNRRGSIIESTLIPGKKVIPIIHPAAALRDYNLRHFILFDLKRCAREANSPDIKPDDREYILRPSFSDSIDYLTELLKKDRVAFDIEVSLGQISCISFAPSEEEAISIPFVEGAKEYFTPPQEARVWKAIASILENEAESVAHNGIFDAQFLFDRYGIQTRNIHDTMIACAILYPDFPKSLAFVTSLYSTIPYYKDEGKANIFGKGGSDLQFWQYNAKDSIVLMEALPKMLRDLERQGNGESYEITRRLIEPLMYMSARGLRVDREGLLKASAEAAIKLKAIQEEVSSLIGRDINLNSPKQLAEFFYIERGVKPFLKDGKPTTDETAIKRLAKVKDQTAARIAQLTLEHRGAAKMDGTYYKVKLDPSDGRLRSSVNPVGTKTGRFSMSKTIYGLGANLQTLPKEMKKYILTDEGYTTYSVDMAQAENRIVALLCGDPKMLTAFEEGQDIHSLTGSMIARVYGEDLSPEEVKLQDKLYEQTGDKKYTCPLGGHRFTWRQIGKKGGHGTNYGLGQRKAALLWEVTEADAKFVIESYHQTFPFIRQWHRRIFDELRSTRRIHNLFGRVYQYWDRLDQSLSDAIAWNPQSSNVENVNRNGVLEIYYNQETFGGLEFLLQVHDSVVFQIPLSLGWDYHSHALSELKNRLQRPLVYSGRELSIPAEVTIHPKNLGEGEKVKDINPASLEAAYKSLL